MKKVISSFTEEEYDLLTEHTLKLGFSNVSTYIKYQALLPIGLKDDEKDTFDMIKKLHNNLDNVPVGSTFIVSSLLPDEWTKLNRSQKFSLSRNLSDYIKNNPDKYLVHSKTSANINIYQKIK